MHWYPLTMSQPLTADDLLPLVARLDPAERSRLVRLIAAKATQDAQKYLTVPPKPDEFATEDDPLAWDAEGWDALP